MQFSLLSSAKVNFSLIFTVLKYTILSESYNSTKQAAFPIHCNIKVLKDCAESYSRIDITFIKLSMSSEKAIILSPHGQGFI